MNIPRTKLANITDFSALQNDCMHLLLSCPALGRVNIIEERKFLLDSDVEISSVWQTPRGGASGVGIIVELAKARVTDKNVTGPIFDLDLGFAVLEERNINLTPGAGSLLTAEQISQIIFDILHLYNFGGIGTLKAEDITPAGDWIDPQSGIMAHRARLTMKNPRAQTQRTDLVSIRFEDGQCTLTCATPDAEIYYSASGQDAAGEWIEPGMPAPSNTGAGAIRYEAPFEVAPGQIIRAAAFSENRNPSHTSKKIVTP